MSKQMLPRSSSASRAQCSAHVGSSHDFTIFQVLIMRRILPWVARMHVWCAGGDSRVFLHVCIRRRNAKDGCIGQTNRCHPHVRVSICLTKPGMEYLEDRQSGEVNGCKMQDAGCKVQNAAPI